MVQNRLHTRIEFIWIFRYNNFHKLYKNFDFCMPLHTGNQKYCTKNSTPRTFQ